MDREREREIFQYIESDKADSGPIENWHIGGVVGGGMFCSTNITFYPCSPLLPSSSTSLGLLHAIFYINVP